ncbi:FAD dependent oxidoreductase [Amylostereum chailletii]|nr:FAD dependent oxidoreductase [Amylostereum chailletii]
MAISKTDKIIIVGAGCFGISTAYHLLKRGFIDVTVIDRSPVLPAPDAASTDINKIVRSSYPDSYYTKLARDAISSWKDVELWGNTYRQSGVLVLGSEDGPYARDAYENDRTIGARVTELANTEAIRSVIPSGLRTGSFHGSSGYHNMDGGWAFAAQGVSKMMAQVEKFGGKVIPGKAAAGLVKEDGRVVAVSCADGSVFDGDVVVLASGSWTASSFPELDLNTQCLATGQSIAGIQLTAEEANLYRECPVIVNFSTGFYMFPPNDDNVVKLALHAAGYTGYPADSDTHISTPRTITSHGVDGLLIPREVAKLLRDTLWDIYPELAEKPFAMTRLCWRACFLQVSFRYSDPMPPRYTDSPDSNWIIGPHPSLSGLVLATAGSGHAYKFLPVIGSLVADAIEGKMDPAAVERFSPERQFMYVDGSRKPAERLDLADTVMCTPDDLLP